MNEVGLIFASVPNHDAMVTVYGHGCKIVECLVKTFKDAPEIRPIIFAAIAFYAETNPEDEYLSKLKECLK